MLGAARAHAQESLRYGIQREGKKGHKEAAVLQPLLLADVLPSLAQSALRDDNTHTLSHLRKGKATMKNIN